MHFAAYIERAEKQLMLAKHGRRLLNYLDDTPVVPGDVRPPFEHASAARQVLNDAEEDLRTWEANLEPVHSSAGNLGSNLMPSGEVPESTVGDTSDIASPSSTIGDVTSPTRHHYGQETQEIESTAAQREEGSVA